MFVGSQRALVGIGSGSFASKRVRQFAMCRRKDISELAAERELGLKRLLAGTRPPHSIGRLKFLLIDEPYNRCNLLGCYGEVFDQKANHGFPKRAIGTRHEWRGSTARTVPESASVARRTCKSGHPAFAWRTVFDGART